jgi:hypothetical protein
MRRPLPACPVCKGTGCIQLILSADGARRKIACPCVQWRRNRLQRFCAKLMRLPRIVEK